MFQRVMIQDASGNLLEIFENYNDLYCCYELLTKNRLNREEPGTVHVEGLVLTGYDSLGVNVNTGETLQALQDNANAAAVLASF